MRQETAAIFAASIVAAPLFAPAQTPPATAPSPAASAAPAAPTDPCASLSTLVSRPTFSTAACSIKASDLLIEAGYTNLSSGGNAGSSLVTFPQANLRVGAGHNVEFDLGPPSAAYLSGNPRQVGITDGFIGLKYEIGYTSRFLYGVNAIYTLQSGNANVFSSNGDGILANVNAGFTVSPAISLFATVGYNAQNAGTVQAPARYHDVQPSLGTSISLPQSFDVFLEGFDQSSTGPGLGGRFGYDTGFQKDIGSRLQLDFNYFNYLGVQLGAHQHSIGFGAAYLIGS